MQISARPGLDHSAVVKMKGMSWVSCGKRLPASFQRSQMAANVNGAFE
jgi:hypothetical protein